MTLDFELVTQQADQFPKCNLASDWRLQDRPVDDGGDRPRVGRQQDRFQRPRKAGNGCVVGEGVHCRLALHNQRFRRAVCRNPARRVAARRIVLAQLRGRRKALISAFPRATTHATAGNLPPEFLSEIPACSWAHPISNGRFN